MAQTGTTMSFMTFMLLISSFQVTSGIHFTWSDLFSHRAPLQNRVCPMDDLAANEIYELEHGSFHCSSSVRNECCVPSDFIEESCNVCLPNIEHGRFRLSNSCHLVNMTVCGSFECKRSCKHGYSRDENGNCVSTDTLHCFNGVTSVQNKCVCAGNFTGKQCDVVLCSPDCLNGGVCSYPPHSKCYCPHYLTGRRCETPVCGSGCKNGGECILSGMSSKCVCRPGFMGNLCQVEYPAICAADDVPNPKGNVCYFDSDCDEGEYCCLGPTFMTTCNMPKRNITCTHQDGTTVAENDIYDSLSHCETCVCQRAIGTNSSEGLLKCTPTGCTDNFLSNPLCCPNTTDYKPCPPPTIKGCPRKWETVPVYVMEGGNRALLVNTFEAHDCLGKRMNVYLSRQEFRSCQCGEWRQERHNVIATSTSDFNGRNVSCEFQVQVIDNIAPVFKSCPASIYATDVEVVTWAKPEVTDNVGIDYLQLEPEGTKNNSANWSRGVHSLVYVASDWQSNKAYCNFKINIYADDATTVPPEMKSRQIHKSGIIIAGSVVGVLAITMLLLIIAMVRFCRIRAKRLQATNQRHNRQRESCNHSSVLGDVYTIYNTDPPPYEVAAKHKLPDYSPSDDPPVYQEAYSNPGYTITQEAGTSTDTPNRNGEEGSTRSKRVTEI